MRYDVEFDDELERRGEIESDSHDEYGGRDVFGGYGGGFGSYHESGVIYGSRDEYDRHDECDGLAESEKRLAIDYEGDPNWSALHEAVKYGYTEIVRVLLEVPDVDVNDQDDSDGY
eukprot:173780_1